MSIEEDIQSKTNVALSGAHTSTKAWQSPLIQSILIQYQIDPSINPWKIFKKVVSILVQDQSSISFIKTHPVSFFA